MEDKLHIGLIMDGNGRWASSRHLPRTAGHLAGLKALKKVALGAIKNNVGYLTLYCFSTENWKRPKMEVDYLMGLFSEKVIGELPFFNNNGIKLLFLGDMEPLPEDAKKALNQVIDETKNNGKLIIQLAINYGGQDEVCRAVNRALSKGITLITPEVIRSNFDNPEVPPVDVIARSAGEMRLSNFLLWDSAYAEFISYKKLWPDWDECDIVSIIDDFGKRNRKFGGLGK
ncbi:MAG: di-trans,poly-cis-decaprenylcistransferase [Sphaerochaetaceae bacterium]|nr:di-trans,poly-cis-decaprenylcistransferase [Sphaerochaetaceae bacterium]